MTRSLLALLIAAAILVPGCLGPPGEGDPTLRHTYAYEISLSVDRTVDDLVLRLPLPSVNGTSAFGGALANGTGYGVRAGWEVGVVEANGTPVLEVRAGRFVPEYRSTPVPLIPGEPLPSITPPPPATGPSVSNPILMPYSLGASIAVNHTIETRDPVGREPLLGGGAGAVPTTCRQPGQGEGVRCYVHPVEAFAEYRGDAPVNITIGVRLAGSNEWWRGGWVFNAYTDQVIFEFPPGERGWTRADAALTAGEGVYP